MNEYTSEIEVLKHHHRAIYRAQRLAECGFAMALTSLIVQFIIVVVLVWL